MDTVRGHRGNECPCPGASSRGHPSLRSILPDKGATGSQKGQQAVAGLHYHSYAETHGSIPASASTSHSGSCLAPAAEQRTEAGTCVYGVQPPRAGALPVL